ncbi:hypothetical protein OAG24_01105 [bacterium]|nr:hypothetical protein [bacterium]
MRIEHISRLEAIGILAGIRIPMILNHKSATEDLRTVLIGLRKLSSSFLEAELSGDKKYKIVEAHKYDVNLESNGIIHLAQVMAKYKCKYTKDRMESQIRYAKLLEKAERSVVNGLYHHFIGDPTKFGECPKNQPENSTSMFGAKLQIL